MDDPQTDGDGVTPSSFLYLSPSKNTARPMTAAAVPTSNRSRGGFFRDHLRRRDRGSNKDESNNSSQQQHAVDDYSTTAPASAVSSPPRSPASKAPLLFRKVDGTLIDLSSVTNVDGHLASLLQGPGHFDLEAAAHSNPSDETVSLQAAREADEAWQRQRKRSQERRRKGVRHAVASPVTDMQEQSKGNALVEDDSGLVFRGVLVRSTSPPAHVRRPKPRHQRRGQSPQRQQKPSKPHHSPTRGGASRRRAKDILSHLQSMPRPSTVPHKPLPPMGGEGVKGHRSNAEPPALAADATPSSASASPTSRAVRPQQPQQDQRQQQQQQHQNSALWAPSAFLNAKALFMPLRPQTPSHIPARSTVSITESEVARQRSTPQAVARAARSAAERNRIRYDQRVDTNNNARTDRLHASIAHTPFPVVAASDSASEFGGRNAPADDSRSDVGSEIALRKHEASIRPSPVSYQRYQPEDHAANTNALVLARLKKEESLFMARKHKARSQAHSVERVLKADIKAVRDTLPLDFLFKHNMSEFVVERGLDKVRSRRTLCRLRHSGAFP